MNRARTVLLVGSLSLALVACGGDAPELMVAQREFPMFEAEIYPVLMRDCAFSTCHGSSERFLQVFGPGRARLDPLTPLLDPQTSAEVMHAYARALSMIDSADPSRSLLLRKPLSLAAGGAGHEGVDAWMRAVYVTTEESNYKVLERWASGVVLASVPGAAP